MDGISSAGADLAKALSLRPEKEEIIKKGVINKAEMEFGNYYELDDTKLDDHIVSEENDYYSDIMNMMKRIILMKPIIIVY